MTSGVVSAIRCGLAIMPVIGSRDRSSICSAISSVASAVWLNGRYGLTTSQWLHGSAAKPRWRYAATTPPRSLPPRSNTTGPSLRSKQALISGESAGRSAFSIPSTLETTRMPSCSSSYAFWRERK